MHHVFGHSCVYLTRKFDEARVLAILPRFPCEVEWIDWNTVAAKTRPGIERHKPKWLRLGRFNDFPDIDAHGAVNELQFVDQRDIHTPENILQQLRSFGDARRRDWYKCVDRLAIKRHGTIEAS